MKPKRGLGKGSAWLSALCALSLLFAVANTRAASTTAENLTLGKIAVVKADGAPEGSALACVRDLVAQGISVKEAVDRCALRGELVPGRAGIDSFLGLGGMTASTNVGTTTCNDGAGVNPDLGQDHNAMTNPSREAPAGKYDGTGWEKDPGYKALKDEAQKQWAEYWDTITLYADQDLSKLTTEEWQQALGHIAKENADANKAIKEREAWQPKTSQTDPNAASVCADIATFIGECNRSAWKTSPCEILLGKFQGCSDPTVTDPAPDGDGAVGCKQADPDAETVQRLGAIACYMRINPSPGEDPCVPVQSAGIVLNGWMQLTPCRASSGGEGGEGGQEPADPPGNQPLGPEGPTIPCDPGGDATPCGNPAARTEEDQCVVGISISQFGEKDIEDILDVAGDRLGGPVFVVPLPGPPVPGGPDPDGP